MKITRKQLRKVLAEALYDSTDISDILTHLNTINESLVSLGNELNRGEGQGLSTGNEDLDFQIEQVVDNMLNVVSGEHGLIGLLHDRQTGKGAPPSDMSWMDGDDSADVPPTPGMAQGSHLRVIKED